MAFVKTNIFTRGASGTVGDMMNFRVRKGKTVIAVKRGPSSKPPTEAQQETNERFIIASLFAQDAMKDPATKALYQKAAKGGQTAYNVALRDAMNPPVIDGLDISGYKGTAGDLIAVKARDVITPASVKVAIFSQAGAVLEQGDAVINTRDRRFWIYTVTTTNAALTGTRVVAIATDLPGNKAEETVTIS
ncbi:hypothetical protein [Chitinophaga filiformis]|uniref:Uncharacterized protein n=1 Tax=Chitinophaga filiformis TaxID=104663 RepID=A0A1G7SI38_CHIFI|nr:hypothetical protein [Chitinophaga filiformis]SDG22673.1 hypothetical protein SAMN04488121_103881 [Chitinophaga filiformis]